jgi:adenosylcobinamide-GDP ribazoletransferase
MSAGRDLLVASMFLTRLPIRSATPWRDDDLTSSVVMFPVIGGFIGLFGAAVYAGATALNLPSFLAASLTLAALIAITGALHEDGLADIADGFGGGRTRDDKLRIMRDSRLGSYGALALGLGLLLRIGALAALAEPAVVASALIATGALSRAVMPIAMVGMARARSDGLAVRAGRPHPGRAGAAFLIAILLAGLCLAWPQALIVLLAVSLAAGLLLLLAQRQIGGLTGDVIGALQQTAEITGLLALVALTSGR